ncbi:hypothetical protein J3Q64DRAFT_1750797 [Phycomyces blakesleeanus]|uniref:Uncharacterized protein n=1 Tax=Phycomyces blakesleeanus TaxID=4837 RepID=A0ABR3AVZ2_PHYBL
MKFTLIIFAALATIAATADPSSVAEDASAVADPSSVSSSALSSIIPSHASSVGPSAVASSAIVVTPSKPTGVSSSGNPLNGATATASISVVGHDANKDSGATKLALSALAGLLVPAVSYALL